MKPLPERHGVDRATFEREVVPGGQPVVLRGLVAHWPLAQAAQQGDDVLAQSLRAQAAPAEVDAVLLPPSEGGRLFYGAGWQGFNFLRNRLPLAQVLDQVLRYARFDPAPAVAVQSAPTADCLPGFAASHPLPVLDAGVPPRLWLGTALVTPAHFDESLNVACVVAGQRRFTLFPPEQVANLSIGPVGHAPTGTPISLVDFAAPDLQRFPRFAQAMQAGLQADLAPGDAIYIPPLWWHHVQSLAPLNLLINYWWKPAADIPSALPALLHAMMALGSLPADQRRAWQALFAHWVFDADEATSAHLPAPLRGVHGEWTPELRSQVRAWLVDQLKE